MADRDVCDLADQVRVQRIGRYQRGRFLLMVSDLRHRGAEASVFPTVVAKSRRGNGFSQGAIWAERLPTLAPRSLLSWGLFLLVGFAGNVLAAVFAWFIVELVMR